MKRKLKSLTRRAISKVLPRSIKDKISEALRHPALIDTSIGILHQSPLSLNATLREARAARKKGHFEASLKLLEGGLKRVKTSSVLLTDLANHRISDGDFDDASILIKRALILNPSHQAGAKAYLRLHNASNSDVPLRAALLSRFRDDMPFVWSFCKACKTEADLVGIFDALAPTGTLPAKYIRPYGNAALRAECFDLGREQFLRAIQNAAENPPLKTTSAKSIGDAGSQALVDIVRLLNKGSVPHFAAAGTCLGMVREGRPLPHDNDIDIGIMEENFDQKALLALTEASPLFISSQPHPKSPKIGLKHINGAEIDLFKFYEEDGQIWHNGVFVRWGNSPFSYETVSLKGTDITIPAGKNYLVENYGTEWYRPDALFDAFLNGPNREVIWGEYYAAHMLRTINLTLRRGNVAKAVGFMTDGIDGPYLTRLEKDTLRIIRDAMESTVAKRNAKEAAKDVARQEGTF